MCKVSVSKWVRGGEGRAAQCGLRKRAGAGREAGSQGNSVPKEEGPPTSGIDPGPPLLGRWPRTGVLAASPTLRDLSKQSRAKPPTCRGPRAPRRRQRADRLRRGAPLRTGRGTHCSGALGERVGAAPRGPAASPGASAGARPRFSPPAAAAPRPPGPRRLRGSRSGRWSRARGGRAGGKVGGAGAAGAAGQRGEPR